MRKTLLQMSLGIAGNTVIYYLNKISGEHNDWFFWQAIIMWSIFAYNIFEKGESNESK